MAHGSWLMAHGSWLMAIIAPCAVLVLLTIVTDIIAFAPDSFNSFYTSFLVSGFYPRFIAYLASFVTLTALFTALNFLPIAGSFFMWLAWFILTVPCRLFYFTMKAWPTDQDLLNLFSVKLKTSVDTIFGLLTPRTIIMAIAPSVIILIIFYFILRILKFKKPEFSIKKRFAVFIIGMLIFGLHFRYQIAGAHLMDDSMGRSVPVLRGFCVNLVRVGSLAPVRRPFTAENARTAPDDNILFIIDESIRGDYVSINNPEIGTTEVLEKYLKKYPGNFYNYGVAVSTATSSMSSRSVMMTGVNNLPDTELRTFFHPNIFDIAKANGYKTILINVQGDFPDIVIREDDLERIDEVYLSDKSFNSFSEEPDFNAANYLNERLKNEKGLFIFLEKAGLHIPYEKRYPGDRPENQKFMPKLEDNEWYSLENRQKVVNSYKNGIRYNLNGFFENLFGENPLDLKNCTIIWTSDHGESFMEYGQLGGHGSGYFEQTLVPFLFFSTDFWVLENLKRPDKIKCTLSQLNIYPTLQSIICRDLNHSSGDYNSLVSDKEFKNPPLIYIGLKSNGSIWNGKPMTPESIDENGKIILPVEKYLY